MSFGITDDFITASHSVAANCGRDLLLLTG